MIEPDKFRQLMGCFPTGVVTLCLTCPHSGVVGITINSLTSVSLEPPLILFCMKKKAQTHERVIEAKSFSLSVLAHHQANLAHRCAQPGGATLASAVVVQTSRGLFTVKGAVAALECGREHLYDGGDHTIVMARVQRLHLGQNQHPLVFYQSQFTQLLNVSTIKGRGGISEKFEKNWRAREESNS